MINPYEVERDPEPDDDTRRLCGCGDDSCWLVETDPTNVNVNGTWFACDCTGICFFCGLVDSLHRLVRISGSWLSHEGCAKAHPVIAGEMALQQTADEQRDDFEQRRR